MRRAAIFLAVSFMFASQALGQGAGDRMLIDYIDTQKYTKEGKIRFYLDVLDRTNSVIPDQDKDKLKFFLDDEPISGDLLKGVDLSIFKDIGEPIAVGILFSNYRGYQSTSAGEASVCEYSVNGVAAFVKELKQNFDWIGVWMYNESGNDAKANFSTDTEGTATLVKELLDQGVCKRIGEMDGDKPSGEGEKTVGPPFYRHFSQTVDKMADLEDLPRRRILVVISDGFGEYESKAKDQIDKKIKGITTKAKDGGIKIYAYGAVTQEDQFLPYLQSAAINTDGVYQKISVQEDLEGKVRELAEQIQKQYVVDVHAPGLPEGKGKFRVDCETPTSQKVSAVYKPVPVPETKTNWPKIIKWSLIGLGSLFGLFFFIWVIKKIINRKPKVRCPDCGTKYPKEDGECPNGPHESGGREMSLTDKGKLRVKSGPMAGEIFQLTDDITTIGCIDGNSVVLYDEGVSKRHAGIKIEEMRYELADFGSTNGTWVNGRKINKQFLRDGDEIRIGNTEMTFSLK